MIRWMFDSAELPPELGSLDFWQAETTRRPGELRSDAADALSAWRATNPEPGRYAVLGKAPHAPFQSNNFANLGEGFTTEWIGPGIKPDFVPNSVAVLYDALARATASYIQFETAQGRDPLAA